MIYHITTKENWEIAIAKGFYEAPSLHTEGFIHNSTETQVGAVLERYYAGQTNLVKLYIDETKLTAELKYELAPSVNEMFPHIFGVINLDAILKAEML
ncbi:MAG: DUF952 domain-containing protein [Ferruginibacter sp.]|nr:DUF952 domain-containing protein [Ferruginibacter sp.]